MAQLTMQRHTPFAYEERASVPQTSETKSSSYKALKSEPTDHFQKNISEQNDMETDNKKISDRGLKRSQNTNDTKSDQVSHKKLKPLQLEKQMQILEDHPETMMTFVQNEPTQETLSLISLPKEVIEIETDLFVEHEEVESFVHLQETESVTTNRRVKQKLQEDLASIATLDEQQITPPQEAVDTEQPIQLVQAAPSSEPLQNLDDSKEDSFSPQIPNSLLSAAQIEDDKQTLPELISEKETTEVQAQSAMLFPTQKRSDTSDLEDISELKTDDSVSLKETPKRKKPKEVNETSPKQLSFAFIEKPEQEFKLVTEASVTAQKPEIKEEPNLLNIQQEKLTQTETKETEKSDPVVSSKNTSFSTETTVSAPSTDKPLQAFGIIADSSLSTTGPIADLTPSVPSLMPAPTQTAPEQVAVKLITALNNGDDQIHIRLTPEDLGEITIKLNISDQRVNALIQSDNAETLKLLQRDSQTLENALKESGFTLESQNMEFSFSGGGSRQDQAILQNEITELRSSLLDDDMLTSLTDLSARDAQGRDYILTPTKVDIHI